MSYSIFHSLPVKTTAKTLYNAITQPEHLVNWWPLTCSGTPSPEASYNFYFSPEYNWYARVITAEPQQAFHLKMTDADADWTPTAFGFDLEPVKEGIQLNFWHTGWPECNAHFKRSSFCWAILLNNLKIYVEQGSVVPFKDRA
ncbi:SRPBCC family protein [Formosa sp. S-31]|uniref:SRPBCC family protein n=1 Tax=Formosa sp. S-31 TaxID=2790949 RepID=UPI003EBB2704